MKNLTLLRIPSLFYRLTAKLFFLDPYIQLSFGTRSATSKIIFKKLNPTWDQMLVLENVVIYGHYDQVAENPPDVLLEIFDYDPVVSFVS